MLPTEINDTITKYWHAFNAMDLDTVMTCFSEEAVYEPGDGKTHTGKAEIRAAFVPQFNFAFGAMRFDEHDRVIDVENHKLVLRRVCRHDISHAKPGGLAWNIRKIAMRCLIGNRFGWQGVDVFHFNADGKIKGKFTYAWYGRSPHIQRELQ
jgi:ketosteroid isomerase-like protein